MKNILLGLMFALYSCAPAPVVAQNASCAPIGENESAMRLEGYTPFSTALVGDPLVTLVVWVNPEGKWVALYVDSTQSCVVASGSNWKLTGDPV
jgi:hypothetical protein